MSMSKHYDESYFFSEKHGGKRYCDSAGEEKTFGYTQGGMWNFKGILDKLIELLGKPMGVLDLGAGCGGFVATIQSCGIGAVGFEFSRYAISNAIMNSQRYLVHADVSKTPWKKLIDRFEWITAIDLFEHLFEEDVDAVIQECKKWAGRFIIAKICTAQKPNEVWSAKKDTYEKVYAQAKKEGFEWLVVSGHVNSQFPKYWIDKFVDDEWQLRTDYARKLKKDLSLPEDWRTTIILERVDKNVKPLPKSFTQNWYDKTYFVDSQGKPYHKSDGIIAHHGYRNPSGDLEAAELIAKAWKKLFQPRNMLDVGAGRGTFVAYARDQEIAAVGFDYSRWATTKGRYSRCDPEWLRCHDATKRWPYLNKTFDLVTVLDFYEHIYESDLDFVIKEMYRVADEWIFLLIATVNGETAGNIQKKPYILKRGQNVPLELEEIAVSGHVTVQPSDWWLDRLDHEDWTVRRDMAHWFVTEVGEHRIQNWILNTIIVLEKV